MPSSHSQAEPDRTHRIDWHTALVWTGMPPATARLAQAALPGRPEFDAVFELGTKRLPILAVLCGPNGNGKTHMGSWLFAQVYAIGHSFYSERVTSGDVRAVYPTALWTTARGITAALKNFSKGGFDFERELAVYTQPGLLMIDDLYAEGASDYDNANLVELIETRLVTERKRTIVTTNLSVQEISDRFSRRLADRMLDYDVIRFTGASFRGRRA